MENTVIKIISTKKIPFSIGFIDEFYLRMKFFLHEFFYKEKEGPTHNLLYKVLC